MKVKFTAVYEECKDAVYGYLLYMTRDAELAEDLSQETFLKMFLNMGKFRGASSLKTWAFKIAHNTFLTYARKKQPLLLEEQSLLKEAEIYQNEPEDNILRKEKQDMIHRIMMTLNEQERTILLLCDYERLSYEEIAEVMGVSKEVIKSRIYRARQKFRKRYQSEDIQDSKLSEKEGE